MTYKSLIFTTHALERSQQRHLQLEDIYQTVKFPTKAISLDHDKLKAIKQINGRQIQVVTAPKAANQRLVISVWVRGEEDQASLLMQIFESLKSLVKFIFTAKTA